MSRTVVIPLAMRSGRMNSRLPVGSPAPVRWMCMSARPGIRNLPVASITRVPFGIWMEESGPTAKIFSASIRIVEFGFGGAPVASIMVAWVMAMVAGGGLWQGGGKGKGEGGRDRGGNEGWKFVLYGGREGKK